mmetsp:Transcript_3926/g.6707  ORF Transcript_3926/g.6707 Transcript_3926/m.6707 type:complete len:379 (-) Transcript_3926:768-1904(-)|eukprot:CAMPEP_0198199336 /NCGR_PEP_ID=MMETSP1445-20131203/2649_1 /TAXON_ID=36898 /ORGANISM="Pyramimonas sp., Strain CCMP2087" /LENGTH=378 /DNA_ID=CAMNT_0043869159 /DNA_START=768 /DNA_END=1904 /DNA_ORIENTATION=-
MTDSKDQEVLAVRFNQDYGCFACGTDSGFRIYNCDPFTETFRREFDNGGDKGGIGQVEMLFRCNILALAGGGRNPMYPPNKVMIWDDHQSRCIGELSFRSEVRAVRLRRDRVVVVLEHKIYVYNFADLKLLHTIETIANPKGICALSPNSSQTVLACPGLHRGEVRVELYDLKRTKFIAAHDGSLSSIALTLDGSRLVTTSEKGTIIRIFDTSDGTQTKELRRGADRAVIYSLAFSPDGEFLATSSDKGTVHVYVIKQSQPSGSPAGGSQASGPPLLPHGGETSEEDSRMKAAANQGSVFAFAKSFLPKYFGSEWSFAQFRLPEDTPQCIVAFGAKKNTLIIVGTNGTFFKCSFDPVKGGECKQESYCMFIKQEQTDE